MSTPTSTTSQTPTSPNDKLLSALSLTGLILCPIIIALPPRKLDFYTISLLSATAVSGNHVAQTYTGRSILTRLTTSMPQADELPTRAQEIQRRLKEEKASLGLEGEKKGEQNVLKKLWMGGEGEDWKAKRDQREKEALEQGKGYGDLIVDQVWEVWNGKEKGKEEGKEGKSGKEEEK